MAKRAPMYGPRRPRGLNPTYGPRRPRGLKKAPSFGPVISRAGRYRVRMRVNTDPVLLAAADALVGAGEKLLARVLPNVPDASDGYWYVRKGERGGPRAPGKGLVDRGGVAGWALGKRIDQNEDIKSPRGFKPSRTGIDVAIGFGFPARFQETGTVHQPARPFLGPAGHAHGPGLIVDAMRDEFRRGLT